MRAIATDYFLDRLKIQHDRIRKMEYQFLGKLDIVVMHRDAAKGVPMLEAERLGRQINFMNDRRPLALSLDGRDILLPFGLPRELPDIPDPNQPPRRVITDEVKFIPQRWEDRASGVSMIAGHRWLVFQPVMQIVLLGSKDSPLCSSGMMWPSIFCAADGMGRHMALIVRPSTGEALFIGGTHSFSTRLIHPSTSERESWFAEA